jgi:hypothetical protein
VGAAVGVAVGDSAVGLTSCDASRDAWAIASSDPPGTPPIALPTVVGANTTSAGAGWLASAGRTASTTTGVGVGVANSASATARLEAVSSTLPPNSLTPVSICASRSLADACTSFQ